MSKVRLRQLIAVEKPDGVRRGAADTTVRDRSA
jgi:hypothetical protein